MPAAAAADTIVDNDNDTNVVVVVENEGESVPPPLPPPLPPVLSVANALVEVRESLAFGKIVRTGVQVYAPLETPILVVTPPLLVKGSSTEDRFVVIDPASSEPVRSLLQAIETEVEDLVVRNKNVWFPAPTSTSAAAAAAGKKPPEISDDAIRSQFKSFFDAPQGPGYRFKLPADAQAFDEDGEPIEDLGDLVLVGKYVRIIFEFTRISFGKTEYGVSLAVKQLRLSGPPPPPAQKAICLIDDDDNDGNFGGGDDDDDDEDDGFDPSEFL